MIIYYKKALVEKESSRIGIIEIMVLNMII
jgi:hypothetical protein